MKLLVNNIRVQVIRESPFPLPDAVEAQISKMIQEETEAIRARLPKELLGLVGFSVHIEGELLK